MRDFKAATYSRLSKRSCGGGGWEEGEQIEKVGNKREKLREQGKASQFLKGTREQGPPSLPEDPQKCNKYTHVDKYNLLRFRLNYDRR